MKIDTIVIIYLLAMNLISLCLMGLDKWKAKRGAWRISEKTLFGFALLGGSVGAILGMYWFHHKTRHWYFVWGMPAILLIHIILAAVWVNLF